MPIDSTTAPTASRTAHSPLANHDRRTIYAGLPNPITVGRYHSLIAGPNLPDELEVTSRLEEIVMGVRHVELPAEGVQFHPESVLTPHGMTMVAKFLGVDAPPDRKGRIAE